MNTKNAFAYLTGQKAFDKEAAFNLALQGAEEGIVLLENKNAVLPLRTDSKVAFFGRMQKEYVHMGTGSGGRVHLIRKSNIFDSLAALGLKLDTEVEVFYDRYVEEHPYVGHGQWSHPASQEEPILEEEFVASAAARNEIALFVITRTAGECRDLAEGRGEFRLSEGELANLKLLRSSFSRLVILLNLCGVMEFAELAEIGADGILLLWQGGMMGAEAAANVLMGVSTPCGKLPDTSAYTRDDYPAKGNFGDPDKNIYTEDIFVGYRYFHTFAPEKIVYPFGYGLSYTTFETKTESVTVSDGVVALSVSVTNTGAYSGKEVAQCYVCPPCGRLGKPAKVLAAFAKTSLLAPGQSEELLLTFSYETVASYDDVSYCWMLEKGEYTLTLGDTPVGSFAIDEDLVLAQCESTLAPVTPFDRLTNADGKPVYAPVPTRTPAPEPTFPDLPRIPKDGMTLADVAEGKITVEELVSRLSDEDLIHIVRAEGMSSPKVTPGTAAAFVGVTPSLKAMGLPTLCCTDGPCGIRMSNEAKCVCYPSATWNTDLVREAYLSCGNELASYHVDILLGPGTNIHRDPLCGRNFEYFSEDPLLAGKMAAAVCNGLDDAGVSGAVKHFMANSQELARDKEDSILSERAVREIYAKPFEICVKESGIRSVMTSYNRINGRWAASNYDLTTRLLRNDFGFDGFVMTDWWAKVNDENDNPCDTNLAAMVHAMNDVYMVTPDAMARKDNLPDSLAEGTLTRGELQICAINLIRFALDSLSYMAQQEGYGKRDLKAACEDKEPKYTSPVVEGKAAIYSGIARKAVLRVTFVSDTDTLVQTNVSLHVNTKNVDAFIVGGTDGGTVADYREISLVAGNNEFIFTSGDEKARAVNVELFT